MTMHLLKPYINNIGNSRPKPSAKQQKAKAEHEAWLRSQGLHPDQLAARQKPGSRKLKKTFVVDKGGPQCSNGFAPGGAKRSVFDSEWQRKYDDPAMIERERAALRAAEAKKSNVMQTYNKGPVMYASGLKPTELGKRRP